MNNVDADNLITLELDAIERWTVFDRLQTLSIPCSCALGQPLRAEAMTAAAALQIWSVVQQVTQPRLALVQHLSNCWRQSVK